MVIEKNIKNNNIKNNMIYDIWYISYRLNK